jgi:hypothetical protein
MANMKVQAFRNKFERDLRKLIPVACAVAGCTNDGNSATEENEMNALAEIVLDIVARAKRANRKTRENPTESNVAILRA